MSDVVAVAGSDLEAGEADLRDLASGWLAGLKRALAVRDAEAVGELFVEDSGWRDLVALSWTIATFSSRAEIVAALERHLESVSPFQLTVAERPAPTVRERAGRSCIEVFLELRTGVGAGRGVLRLLRDPSAPYGVRGWTISTALFALDGHEERNGVNRPLHGFSREVPGENWSDARERARRYEGHEPQVLVVGGGQAGLATAARLGQLGVDTLVIDTWPRVGDNWRQRYHTLTLHNETWTCHLPYLPFPETFPTYLPKDKLANWFEFYVDALDINYWTSTRFRSATYDERAQTWEAVIEREDGSTRTLHPAHVVMAVGVSGIPFIPALPVLADYEGPVVHTSQYPGSESLAGKSVVIMGTGTSAHDLAADLHGHGAEVTMIQRGATTVVDLEPASILPAAAYSEPGFAVDDVDLLGVSTPFPFSLRSSQLLTDRMRELDVELLRGLEEAGFHTDYGDDGAGLLTKYLKRGGGYYINVGCSQLVIDGKIKVTQFADVDGFTPHGLRLRDGTTQPVDMVVLATGYRSIQACVSQHFGPEVAERLGPVWGMTDHGELANVWKATPHPALWFAAGSLLHCRVLSRFLSLQIKASIEGVRPVLEPPVPVTI